MKIWKYCLTFSLLFVCSVVCAQQTDRDYIRQGNRYYRNGELDKAVTNYQKALEKNRSVEAFYNIGCASALMSQDSTSQVAFINADSLGFTNPLKRAMNFHNLGNLYLKCGLSRLRSNDPNLNSYFQNAVNLYKGSLRCNPSDNGTRYNLALAQWLMKNTQGGGQNNKDDNKDKDKDKDKQQQQDKKQDKQQQQKKEEQKKDEMSDQAAEQLLKSAQQDEKDVQRKVQVQPNRKRSLGKDW